MESNRSIMILKWNISFLVRLMKLDGFTNSERKFVGSIVQFDWVEKMKNVITFLANHKQFFLLGLSRSRCLCRCEVVYKCLYVPIATFKNCHSILPVLLFVLYDLFY